MVKMLMHTEAQSFEISKLKDVIQKPSNLPEATTISDPLKSRAGCHYSFKLGLKLKYLNSD